ncbi:phytoene desaturase family protein [Chloroflexota bacterium]
MADTDYIVIGGGHNGLVTAAYLAKAGQRVIVLERYEILGGYNTTEEIPVAPGYKLNVGALEHIAIFDTPLVGDLDLVNYGLDYIYREAIYLFPFLDGVDIPIYQSIDRTAEEIAKLSPHDAEVYADFMDFSGAFLGILGAVSMGPPPTFGELAALMDAEIGLDTDQVLWVLLTNPRAVLDAWFEHPQVKAALGYYGAHTQTAPSRVGAGYAPFIMVGPHESGVPRPRGGSGKLNDALAAAIEDHGGSVRTNLGARRVMVENGRAVGVETDDGQDITAAKGIVSSIDARRLFLDLVDEVHTPPELRKRLRNLHAGGTNISEFKIDSALSGPLDWSRFPHGEEFSVGMQLLCPSLDYLDNVFSDIQGGLPPEAPAIMVGTASVLDPSLAPEGGHTLWLSSFAPYHRRDGRSWDETEEEFAERLLDRLSLYAPNARDVIVASELTSPLDWHRRTGSIRGNPNHLDMTLDQILGYRPLPELSGYRTLIEGLYLTGSGTHPGGGMTGNPGYNTAQIVLQDLGLARPPGRKGLVERAKKMADLVSIFWRLRKYL